MQRYRKFNCQADMKHLSLYIFCIVLLMSCAKDKFADTRQQFSGTWEYHQFVGYPFLSTPLPRGNGKIIIIGTDGSFERRNHDTTTFKGSYTLEERKDCYGDAKQTFFKSSDPTFAESFIAISGDSLMFNSSNCLTDGGALIYLRN